jgi:hypothetical protein
MSENAKQQKIQEADKLNQACRTRSFPQQPRKAAWSSKTQHRPSYLVRADSNDTAVSAQ